MKQSLEVKVSLYFFQILNLIIDHGYKGKKGKGGGGGGKNYSFLF